MGKIDLVGTLLGQVSRINFLPHSNRDNCQVLNLLSIDHFNFEVFFPSENPVIRTPLCFLVSLVRFDLFLPGYCQHGYTDH